MTNTKQVVFLGKEMVKTYEVFVDGSIYSDVEVISNPQFLQGEIELPMIQKGDYIYIEELEKKVYVEDVVRTNKNGYRITVDHRVGELIENERTEETLEKAEIKSKEIRNVA